MIVSDQVVVMLSEDAGLTAQYPFLKKPPGLGGVKKGCNCRSRSVDKDKYRQWMNNLRRSILGLSPEVKQGIKARLGASKLVVYINENNRVSKHEI